VRAFVSRTPAFSRALQELIEANGANGSLPALRQIMVGGSRVQGALMRAAAVSSPTNRYLLWFDRDERDQPRSLRRAGIEDGACGYIGPWADLRSSAKDGRALATGQEGVIRTRSNMMGHYVGAPCRD